ncbi:MAG: S8 family serine peptidase [Ferruginibacter sp.]
MQKIFLVIFLSFFFSFTGHAQFSRYIVTFKDKGSNPFSLNDPAQYLSQRALDRRAKYNIAIDSTDLPVTPRYIDSLRVSGNVSILNVSKWLNQVAIQTTDALALANINNLPFVLSTIPLAAKYSSNPVHKNLDQSQNRTGGNVSSTFFEPGFTKNRDTTGNFDFPNRVTTGFYDYGQSEAQIKIHNGNFLHDHGFRGEGMLMAVLDAGFYHYLSLPTFDSVRNNNQVLGTWDFVDNELSVDEDNYHGMQCFSTIAANIPGTFIGTAPKTSFYLFRTEDVNSEYPIEEQNWAAGVEKADSLGVDITSTSLGYFRFDDPRFDHTYADMDGNTTISARAADLAARKGILVVVAAGNEGNSAWHYLITPSDADSALSVGAVDIAGNVAGFSSYGPSGDGQIKPSVAAVGSSSVVASVNNGLPTFSNGTSFACPTMAGVTTCLWQAFPEINNMGIIEALELSATRSGNPDDHIGYGIPDAKKAFVILQKRTYRQQSNVTDCSVLIQLAIKADNTMSIEVEKKLETETTYSTITTLQNTNSYGIHNFIFNDDVSNSAQGLISYRFKMIIAPDTSFYLDSITVNHAQNCNGVTPSNDVMITQQIIQNQVSENIEIRVNRITAAKMHIVIHNAAGQKVYCSQLQQQAGSQTTIISLRKVLASRGAYFISVFIDNKKVKTREILRP